MTKPTYEQLESRVQELERVLGDVLDGAMNQEEHELFELSVLYNVSQAVASVRDLNHLLRVVIDEVNKALLTEGAGVLLYDEARGDLYWREVRDSRHMLAKRDELRLPLDGSIAGWVFRNNRPARVNDTSKDPRYYPGLTEKSGFEVKRVLQVPLNTGERTIGVVFTANKIGGDFSEQDEQLLMSMAPMIALAVENATVYEQLKKTNESLEMLYRASMALASTMDLDHLLEYVISELNRAMDTEAAGVLLYDRERGDLYWREVQDEKGLIGSKAADLRLPVEGSISGYVYRTGEIKLLNDPTQDPRFFREFVDRSGFTIRNELLVPLNTREETIGVLVVINKKQGSFSDEDANLCSSLAGVVAIAVENSTFFQELLASYRDLEDLNRVKTKVLNHLSHELRTPLAIIRGTLATMEKKMKDKGITGFERAMSRMNRHVKSLNRLEAQVESMMMTGYTWERRMITEFLESALALMEVQSERTPEIERAAGLIHKWLETTFPTRKDEPELIDIKERAERAVETALANAREVRRDVEVRVDMEGGARVLIPDHVLEAIVIGLVRNAIEATPDRGLVTVNGKIQGERYLFSVKDTGIGIPESDQQHIFEGFYTIQDTEDYSSGRPYSFNAGGKGIDLLRIRMFSELYGFKLSFESRRCEHLDRVLGDHSGDALHCPKCGSITECLNGSGSEFTVDFPLADEKDLEASAASA